MSVEQNGGKSLPVACTLTPEEMREGRGGLLPGLLALSDEVTRIAGGLRWRFPPSPDRAKQIAAVIDAEHRCCRFLKFTMVIEPGDSPVWLEATGPEGTREFLESISEEKP
ncbi:MAG TPA: hypothetical protein VFW45_11415 [Candidatus Polarisedimenticolia bacterium]|nr:hypothetical protein [Candidatus Polarisedimenticolia bacterium]